MGDKTGIEWTEATLNVISGCTRISPGCDHCYIPTTPPLRMAGRKFDGEGPGSTTGLLFHPERFQLPLSWRRPRRIFVNSLSDVFHEEVPDDFIARLFAVMGLASQHTFQILSKRHGRMRSLLGSRTFHMQVLDQAHLLVHGEVDGVKVPRATGDAYRAAERQAIMRGPAPLPYPLPNVHLGVSVEDQKRAELRIPALLDTPAAVRFLSMEPLLGPVDLTPHMPWDNSLAADPWGIGWVIVGGESGKGARPMHPAWARSIRDQCGNAGVPFLFKQHGEWAPGPWQHGEPWLGHNDPRVGWVDLAGERHDFDAFDGDLTWALMRRVGKHKAGRVLDGRTWDEYPEAVTV